MATDNIKPLVKSKIKDGDYTGAMNTLTENGYSVLEASSYLTELQKEIERE